MLYRKVPKNGDMISILGYGCMRFPLRMKSINEKLAEKQILRGIDKGINYFDTGYFYHYGRSEPFLGKVLHKNRCREKVKIATKLPQWQASKKTEMDEILDNQLRKLKTDRIDYYLIHALNGDMWEAAKKHGVIEFMEDALKKGKILNAGFSFHGFTQDFNTIVDQYDWTFCQIQYNYLDRYNQAGISGLKHAASKDLAVIIMEPLRGGNLARTPPPSVQKIWESSDTRRTPVDWSLSWIWNHPEVTSILSGMNDDRHIEENLKIADSVSSVLFTDRDEKTVEKAAEEFVKVMKVGCTGCQYCMPCPYGVNIPGCFELYNSKKAFKDRRAKLFYIFQNGGILSDKISLASRCTECGKCLEKCPQSLNIPELLKEVAKEMEGILKKPVVWLGRKIMKVKRDR